MFNHYVTNRLMAAEFFMHIFWKARVNTIISKVLRNSSRLKTFNEIKITNKQVQTRFLGVMEIPVERITGTVGRAHDFDGRFRPLKKHMRSRWINVAVLSGGVGWQPIEVYKVGKDYFVIDGHHRTSFARCAGITFIDAIVWEVPQKSDKVYSSSISIKRQTGSARLPIYEGLACEAVNGCAVLFRDQ